MIAEKYTYLFVILFSIVPTFLFSLTPWYRFRDHWYSFFLGNIPIAILYLLFDSYYTSLGVWGFDSRYTIGIFAGNMPIEEVLFFICIPYACLFTYYCFRKYVFTYLPSGNAKLWLISGILYLTLAIYFYNRIYTLFAFSTSALASFVAYRFRRVDFLHFYAYYAVIFLPFMFVNGILTGSFLDRVVVFYDDLENLGFRILTIPFDDTFYGLALLLFNILWFEWHSTKAKNLTA